MFLASVSFVVSLFARGHESRKECSRPWQVTRFFLLRPSQTRSILGHTCLSCQKTHKKLNTWTAPAHENRHGTPKMKVWKMISRFHVNFCSGLAFGPLQIMSCSEEWLAHCSCITPSAAGLRFRCGLKSFDTQAYFGFHLGLAFETYQHIGGIEQIQFVKENLARILPCRHVFDGRCQFLHRACTFHANRLGLCNHFATGKGCHAAKPLTTRLNCLSAVGNMQPR